MQATIDPFLHPELLFYAAGVLLMLLLAGIASLPPRKDIRALAGAAVVFASWVMSLFIVKTTNSFSPSGIQTLLDIVTAGCFYFISQPTQENGTTNSRQNDWAGYVCFIHLAMIFVSITHLSFNDVSSIVSVKTTIYFLFTCVVGLGIMRGFGLATALLSLPIFMFSAIWAAYAYGLTMNILFTLAVAVVILHSARISIANIKSWTKGSDSRHYEKRRRSLPPDNKKFRGGKL